MCWYYLEGGGLQVVMNYLFCCLIIYVLNGMLILVEWWCELMIFKENYFVMMFCFNFNNIGSYDMFRILIMLVEDC